LLRTRFTALMGGCRAAQGVGVSRVTCYLAFTVEGSDRLEVAFPRLLPRLPLLTPVGCPAVGVRVWHQPWVLCCY
jgi:hypothetical protein